MSKDFNVTNTTESYGKYYDVGNIVKIDFYEFVRIRVCICLTYAI